MERPNTIERSDRFWNPYFAGAMLGLVLLASFLVAGKGLGASGAANRFGVTAVNVIAPGHVATSKATAPLKADGRHLLDDWLVFGVLGVFLGGAVGAFTAGRMGRRIVRGPRISPQTRILLAVSGGLLMGAAARIARGCTSGQALSGGALLSVGSWVFMLAIFAGGYGVAYFVRRQWT